MTPPPPPPRCRRLIAGGVAAHLFLLLVLPLSAADIEKSRNFSFPSFSKADRQNLYMLGNSDISDGALQLTPDTLNDDQSFLLVNKSGRILLPDRIKLWTSDRLLSFNTTMLVNVYRNKTTAPGEGLAFVIVPDTSAPPPGSHGGYLGLTNAATDGNSSNHFIAVELDTYRQDYDIDNNHIGLNINSVHSNASVSLSDVGITISPLDGASRLVWIDYDGEAKFIWIYVANESSPKPKLAVLAVPLDLRQHLLRDSYFGFAGSTGTNIELNCVKSWNLTITDLSDHGMEAWKWAVAITVPLLALLIFGGWLTWWICARRRSRDSPRVVSTLRSLPGMPRQFEFKDLKRATNNFDDKLKLGQGGFGVVYKGVVDGTEVAIKKFSRDRMNSQEDFLSELSIINRLRHKHLVRLSGWCHKNEILLLVYDYMPNGSLDQHIFGERPLLTWERRYNAIAGLASALHYLHHEYDERVVHRDLKASNVMLDAGYNARLGDFGLARALETDKTSYADIELGGVPGTLGYIAPECFHTGKATRESDVYGFGTVVLEVACGRRPRCEVGGFSYLADWVWKLHRERRIVDAVDERLAGKYTAAEAERLLLLGLACCHPLPKERPRMTEIVQVVAGAVAPPVVPAFKPAFVWPSATDEEEGTSVSTSTAVTSSCYASSAAEWTPRFLSEDVLGRAGGDGDVASGPGK